MLISEAKAGMVLARDIVDEEGNLLLEQGIALTELYISRLQKMGLRTIPVNDPYAAKLKQSTVVAPQLRNELADCFRSLFTIKSKDILNPGAREQYFKQITQAVATIIDETEKNLPQILNIQMRQPTSDEIGHAVNVCLMSVATGLYIKLPRPVLTDLALGALLHDIGKSIIPVISDCGSDVSGLHPVYGQQLLLRNKIGSTAARIAVEHHERYDGSGYPAGLAGKEIHPLSRLVTIANYFDNAMTEAANKGFSRQRVLDDMLEGINTQFDMYLLRAFFHNVPLYPVGTLVKLSTRQLAYVIRNRARSCATPVVELAGNSAKKEVIDLSIRPHITITQVVAE